MDFSTIAQFGPTGLAIVAFYGIYDPPTRRLTYASAGHNPPRLKRCSDGSLVSLDGVSGLPLGIFADEVYEETTYSLLPGDQVVFYTDGITEPENAYGEMFGEERLIDVLVKYQSAGAAEIVSRSLEAALQWTGLPELQDDMTMLIAQRLRA